MNYTSAMLKKAWGSGSSIVGLLLSGLSGLSAIRAALNLEAKGLLDHLYAAYEKSVIVPLHFVLSLVWPSIPPTAIHFVALYVLFGTTTMITLFKVYDPSDGFRVDRGALGAVSDGLLSLRRKDPRTFSFRIPYTIAAVILWPLIVTEYAALYRNIWARYMDAAGSPYLDAPIYKFASNARVVSDLPGERKWCRYNPLMDHDLISDTWYRREGSLFVLFLANFAAAVLFAVATIAIAYLT